MSETSPRHRARELALQALYALECGDDEAANIRQNVIFDEKLNAKGHEYARFLFDAVIKGREWADSIISSHAANWKLERIAVIDRNILRLALVELDKSPDVPVRVVINEAIELAKTFSTGQSFGFVNGILDQYAKECEKADPKA
ncbi:MAG: transcription antitermination factor NusB [bacterium]|nr:transcription antitermination factor NusB [bacterium]